MSEEFNLWCWILGDGLESYFSVRVKSSETVHALKEAIKTENPSIFKDIDTQALKLHKVSIDLTSLDEESLARLKLDDNPELNASKFISDYWPLEPPKGTLHVVIQASLPGLAETRAIQKSATLMFEHWHAPMHQIIAPQILPSDSQASESVTPTIGALYLGGLSAVIDPPFLSSHGITHLVHVIDGPFDPFDEGHPFICYQIDIEDDERVDLTPHLKGVCDYIDVALQSGGNVLVHCHMGVSRSASIVIAYLIRSKNMTYDAAHSFILSKRGIRPNAGFVKCLREWEVQNRR